MTAQELDMLAQLRKLEHQVHTAIEAIESGAMKYQVGPKEMKPGWEIGDFTITPRFPKTDFQG